MRQAVFRPQAWINNYATAVDAEGETYWDITPMTMPAGHYLK